MPDLRFFNNNYDNGVVVVCFDNQLAFNTRSQTKMLLKCQIGHNVRRTIGLGRPGMATYVEMRMVCMDGFPKCLNTILQISITRMGFVA